MKILGISGGSGSGKTTILNSLKLMFRSDQLCILLQDDYYKPRQQQLRDPNGITNFDRKECFLMGKMIQDIHKIIDGNTIRISEYVFNNKLKSPRTKTVSPAPVMIIEGLLVFHTKEIRALLDLKIFIDADEELRMQRRLHRDQSERNYPADEIIYRFRNHATPLYEQYILPYKEECDLVINNNGDYREGVNILANFINDQMNTVQSTGNDLLSSIRK